MNDIRQLSKLLEEEDILSVLDALHLDEYVVDEGIDKIISKSNVTSRQLNTLLIFVKYKLMLCLQEDEDCDNGVIVDYVLQQLLQTTESSCQEFHTLLKIFSHSLLLNKKSLLNNVEHITQQLMSELITCQKNMEEVTSKCIIYLMIFDDLINTCLKDGVTLNGRFLRTEFENLVHLKDKQVNRHIFSKTVPNLIKCSKDVSFLNIFWQKVVNDIDNLCVDDVSALCVLSEFYFPDAEHFHTIKSSIVKDFDFWKLIQNGVTGDDYLLRKCCIYLGKRAIDYIVRNNFEINIKSNSTDDRDYFVYKIGEKSFFETTWKTFFIIAESLEEKQTHIVRAALDLVPKLEVLHSSWLNCILKRALVHETDNIVERSLEIALTIESNSSSFPYKQLVQALNKIFIWDDFFNLHKNVLFSSMKTFLQRKDNLRNIIVHMKNNSLSPIPRFSICFVLSSLEPNSSIAHEDVEFCVDSLLQSQISNNPLIESGIQYCVLNFYINHVTVFPKITDLQCFLSKLTEKSFNTNANMFSKLSALMKKLHQKTDNENLNISEIQNCDSILQIESFSKLTLILLEAGLLNNDDFIYFVNVKLSLLKECDKRLYASNEQLDSAYFLIINYLSMIRTTCELSPLFLNIIASHCDSITSYLTKCLQETVRFDEFEFVNQCTEGLKILLLRKNINNFIYASVQSVIGKSVAILKTSNAELIQRYFASRILCVAALYVENNDFFDVKDKKYIFDNYYEATSHSLSLITCYESNSDENVSKGEIISAFSKICCDIYNYHYELKIIWTHNLVVDLNKSVIEFLEKGGNDCILSIIKLTNKVLENLMKFELWDDVKILLERVWSEIFEIRKSEQFRKCLQEFVKLLYNKTVFSHNKMHPFLIDYGNKLFELGEVASYAVYFMIKEIDLHLAQCDLNPLHMLIVNALLFGNVPRKDQRIESNTCSFILAQFPAIVSGGFISNPSEEIKRCALHILLNQEKKFHHLIIEKLQDKASFILKSKQRYHGSSMTHRILLRIFQALILSFKYTFVNSKTFDVANWCVAILINQPHHASIRVLAEWYISLHLIHSENTLKSNGGVLGLSLLPELSYFMIIYHVVKHQILLLQKKLSYEITTDFDGYNSIINANLVWENFHFAVETLLPYTMGQIFNIRLHSQYLIFKLYDLVEDIDVKSKYAIMYDTIKKNFELNSDEKHLKKIKDDVHINNFNVIFHLNVENVYKRLPKLMGITQDELICKTSNLDSIKSTVSFTNFDSNIFNFDNVTCDKTDFDLSNGSVTNLSNNSGVIENIQKKFIPWRNMLEDMNVAKDKNVENNENGLIIVASLIDKIPNLGGLSRTCEVFGVKQLVINSSKYVHDKQFQSLSVSSENWVNILEVPSGSDLKDYLTEMKRKGYTIVGAEQSSSSVTLAEFSFPKNMILLLGHEKEGISPELLHMLDNCVEIPQQGMVRSLNVHVTASIFIWEYTKQHILSNKL